MHILCNFFCPNGQANVPLIGEGCITCVQLHMWSSTLTFSPTLNAGQQCKTQEATCSCRQQYTSLSSTVMFSKEKMAWFRAFHWCFKHILYRKFARIGFISSVMGIPPPTLYILVISRDSASQATENGAMAFLAR